MTTNTTQPNGADMLTTDQFNALTVGDQVANTNTDELWTVAIVHQRSVSATYNNTTGLATLTNGARIVTLATTDLREWRRV